MTATVEQTSCTPLQPQSRLRDAGTLYAKVFSEEILPAIRLDVDKLRKKVPTTLCKQAEGVGKQGKVASGSGDDDDDDCDTSDSEFKQFVEAAAAEHKEKKGVRMNLSWTEPNPSQNMFGYHQEICYSMVVSAVFEMFVDRKVSRGQYCTPEPTAASAEEGARVSQPERSRQQILESGHPIPWRIPTRVEGGFEVPILVGESGVVPDIAKLKRLGVDLMVNAVWLAYHWAKQDKAHQAVRALETLILDWPFDFFLIEAWHKVGSQGKQFLVARRARSECRTFASLARSRC